MSTGHVLMGLLRRGQQHGYDLKRQHDELFPAARPMAYGQVYAALGRLEAKGWVRAVATERSGGPERTVYELDGDGACELDRWVEEADGPSPHVANPLGTKLAVARLAGGDDVARSYLRGQRAAHLARMRELTRAKREAQDVDAVLELDYALGHLDADIRWMEDAQARLDEMAKGSR